MDRRQLQQQLREFQPANEEEARDRDEIVSLLEVDNIFYRSNAQAHMTASAWILNPTRDKVLMCYHNIYHSWSWLGGHADGNENLLEVAIREAKEEAGIQNVKALSDQPFSCEILTVDGHWKKGEYVSSHLHINVSYLLQADDKEELSVKQDENSNLGWFSLEEAVKASSEPWFVEHVYTKLNKKVEKLREEEL